MCSSRDARPKAEARARDVSNRQRHPSVGSPALRAAFSATTAIAAVLALPSFSLANPTGGVVVDGAATISSTTNVTNVVQSTNRAIINWQSFSIGLGQTVNFLQPSSLAVTLNRVVGNEQSVIAGALNANGKVFIINSNGIMFTKDAQVNVGGLVASTLDISNSNFMAGNYIFSGSSSAAVVNKGTINAVDGGYVALLGKTVSNEGTINAKLGTIALASGDAITLNFSGDSLLDVTIDKGTYDALVENKGLIQADGGNVMLTAKAADAVLSAQVNNSGVIQARTLADLTGGSSSTGSVKIGKIKLLAQGGTTKVSGTLDASAPNGGKGGTIETSGNKVTIADSAVVTTASSTGETGTWTIDPDGFTIGPNGDITGTLLGSLLASNNITLSSTSGSGTDGNINVNSAVSWSTNTLTLKATNNIYVNAPMTATGSASFVGTYGVGVNADGYTPLGLYMGSNADGTFAGKLDFNSTGTITLNGNAYTIIRSWADFVPYASAASGYYALAGDLTAPSTAISGAVFDSLTGSLNGLGHTISNLTINGTGFINTLGVFPGTNTSATVSNIGLVNASVTSSGAAGALVATNYGTVTNAYATGTVTGPQNASGYTDGTVLGGLVGYNRAIITDSWARVNVTGRASLGGLVGSNLSNAIFKVRAVIINSNAFGNVTTDTPTYLASINIGGLVGINTGGLISYSNAYGMVKTLNSSEVGGLVGTNTNTIFGGVYVGTLSNDTVYGPVNATWNAGGTGQDVGGLVGSNAGDIVNSRVAPGADVTVTTSNNSVFSNVGGLVGNQTTSGAATAGTLHAGSIKNSSANENVKVTGDANSVYAVGGLVGNNSSALNTIANSTATGNVSSNANAVGGLVGLNQGTITDSSATGNVTGSTSVGGLVGTNTNGTISGSSATGDVTGTGIFTAGENAGQSFVGGLVGNNNGSGSISNSSATGSVTGRGDNVGGLIGKNTSSGSVANSTYRDAKAEARAAAQTAAQLSQTRQAALSAGNVTSSATVDSSSNSKRPKQAESTAAGKNAVAAAAAPSVSENIQGEEPTTTPVPIVRARPRQVAGVATTPGAHRPVARGAGYGARIRSIEVDGQHFDLGNGGKNSAPAPKAQ
ncbi:beta strand repeat-containing protein [Methylosinus sporium]|uniref:beta strand repeat-containing protein n=1 Tax=Methylosinus sporium TaxID=428 RepID=UPI00383AF16E